MNSDVGTEILLLGVSKQIKDHQCFCLFLQKSSSSESLSDKGSAELKKSFDAVVFDVLKVTPEEYAVSNSSNFYYFLCEP